MRTHLHQVPDPPRGALHCPKNVLVSAVQAYDESGAKDIRGDVEETVHHGMISTGVLLANAHDEHVVLVVYINIGLRREREGPMDP